MRPFLSRGNFEFSVSILLARQTSEKRVFLRSSKNKRGFLARAFQNIGDKKASKPAIFEIKNRGTKTYAL